MWLLGNTYLRFPRRPIPRSLAEFHETLGEAPLAHPWFDGAAAKQHASRAGAVGLLGGVLVGVLRVGR